MAKLAKHEKQVRKNLLESLKENGGEIFSFPEYKATVAVIPCIRGGKHRFVRVAISHCSDKDTFKRKRGKLVALQAWFDDYTIPVRTSRDMQGDALAIVLAAI